MITLLTILFIEPLDERTAHCQELFVFCLQLRRGIDGVDINFNIPKVALYSFLHPPRKEKLELFPSGIFQN